MSTDQGPKLSPRCTWEILRKDGVELAIVLRDGEPIRATGTSRRCPDLRMAMHQLAEKMSKEQDMARAILGITPEMLESMVFPDLPAKEPKPGPNVGDVVELPGTTPDGRSPCPNCGHRTNRLKNGQGPISRRLASAEERSNAAIELAVRFGGIDGDHHKAWVIDQMVRALAAEGYKHVVKTACEGEDGPNTYPWNEGIPP